MKSFIAFAFVLSSQLLMANEPKPILGEATEVGALDACYEVVVKTPDGDERVLVTNKAAKVYGSRTQNQRPINRENLPDVQRMSVLRSSVDYLLGVQNEDGSWGSDSSPKTSSIAFLALKCYQSNVGDENKKLNQAIQSSFAWISAQPLTNDDISDRLMKVVAVEWKDESGSFSKNPLEDDKSPWENIASYFESGPQWKLTEPVSFQGDLITAEDFARLFLHDLAFQKTDFSSFSKERPKTIERISSFQGKDGRFHGEKLDESIQKTSFAIMDLSLYFLADSIPVVCIDQNANGEQLGQLPK